MIESPESTLERLRNQYLPDLKSLLEECNWLRLNLGLEEKRDMQASEARLLQFVNTVDIVINKIQALEGNEKNKASNAEYLANIESNIVRMILPVRARLHEKWKRNERERLIHQAASSTIDPTAAATLLSQNPGILHSAAVDFQKKAAPKSRTGASTAASKNRSSKTKSSSGNNSGSNSSGKGGVGGAVTGTSSKMSRNSSSGSMSSMGMSIHASAASLPAPNPVSAHPQYYTLPAMPTFNRASGGVGTAPLGGSTGPLPLPAPFLPAYSNSPLSRGLLRAGIPVSNPYPYSNHPNYGVPLSSSGSMFGIASSSSSSSSAVNVNSNYISAKPDAGLGMRMQQRGHVGSMPAGFGYMSGAAAAATGRPPVTATASAPVPGLTVVPSYSYAGPAGFAFLTNGNNGTPSSFAHQQQASQSSAPVPHVQIPRVSISNSSNTLNGTGVTSQSPIPLGSLHISTDNLQSAGSAEVQQQQHPTPSPSASSSRLSPLRPQLAAPSSQPSSPLSQPQPRQANTPSSAGSPRNAAASVGVEEEEDALTANIFDDGCDTVSDLGIYDRAGHTDEFDPMVSHDSLSTVPADWRLHNEALHTSNSYAASSKPSSKNKRAYSSMHAAEAHQQQQGRGMIQHSTSSGVSVISKAEDGSEGGGVEEYVLSARRRRKLSLIVPYPRKPRTADYQCTACLEPYQVLVQDNPWWAVYTHECPSCHTVQFPRIDINLTSNAVELDPNSAALYGEGIAGSSSDEGEEEEGEGDVDVDADADPDRMMGEEGDGVSDAGSSSSSYLGDACSHAHVNSSPSRRPHSEDEQSLSSRSKTPWSARGTNEQLPSTSSAGSQGVPTTATAEGGDSDPGSGAGCSSSNNANVGGSSANSASVDSGAGAFTAGMEAEDHLAKEEASKLLVLMCHARTCTGAHSSPKHAEICKSTKYLMLHIRDCQGLDADGRDCAFPWCKPCKKMLKHLTQCYQPASCSICNPWCLPNSYEQLRRLNQLHYCQPMPMQMPMSMSMPISMANPFPTPSATSSSASSAAAHSGIPPVATAGTAGVGGVGFGVGYTPFGGGQFGGTTSR